MDKRLFTVKEAAAYLAISIHTLYHWVNNRQIPYIKLKSKAVRLDKTTLDKWVDSQNVKTVKEVEDLGTI